MRIVLIALLLLVLPLSAAGAWAQNAPADASSPPSKIFDSPADIQALIAKARAEHKGDAMTSEEVLALAPYRINLEYRTVPTPAAVHLKEAELLYVVQGVGTLTIGGTLDNAKPTKPDNLGGTGITGGAQQPLTPGTYVFVPENTPHWFSAIKDGPLVLITFHVPRPLAK